MGNEFVSSFQSAFEQFHLTRYLPAMGGLMVLGLLRQILSSRRRFGRGGGLGSIMFLACGGIALLHAYSPATLEQAIPNWQQSIGYFVLAAAAFGVFRSGMATVGPGVHCALWVAILVVVAQAVLPASYQGTIQDAKNSVRQYARF